MPRLLTITFSIILMVYLAVAFAVSANEEPARGYCKGISVDVTPTPGAEGFVTAGEIGRELDNLPEQASKTPVGDINTQAIHRRLLAMDKLEDASVVRYTDGSIRITVKPIVPVARVFDGRESYYVNRTGKRVKAGPRFRKSVPLVKGHFEAGDTSFTPLHILPLLDYIASDSVWNSYVSMIEVKGPKDIILIPAIRNHVINLGDCRDLPDKFDRLGTFYRNVLRSQGWEKYDTLTLKWRGQIVTTKRHRRAPEMPIQSFDEDESVSIDAMLAGDNVAPGRTAPGQKAHSDTPIPGRRS